MRGDPWNAKAKGKAKAKTKAAYTCWDVPDIPKEFFHVRFHRQTIRGINDFLINQHCAAILRKMTNISKSAGGGFPFVFPYGK